MDFPKPPLGYLAGVRLGMLLCSQFNFQCTTHCMLNSGTAGFSSGFPSAENHNGTSGAFGSQGPKCCASEERFSAQLQLLQELNPQAEGGGGFARHAQSGVRSQGEQLSGRGPESNLEARMFWGGGQAQTEIFGGPLL